MVSGEKKERMAVNGGCNGRGSWSSATQIELGLELADSVEQL